jgi:hypothetical protein
MVVGELKMAIQRQTVHLREILLRGLIAASLAWLVLGAWDIGAWADEPAVSSVKDSENRSLLKLDDQARAAVGAGSVVSAGQPMIAAALLLAGRGFSLWSALPAETDLVDSKVPPLVNLESVKDETPVRSGEEGLAFCEALVKAHKTSNQTFHNNATRGLTYANLFLEPKLHRGKVVHFEGRLKRLARFEPPEETKLDGVTDRYEGWIFDPEIYGANPVCVVFTDLPAGLEPGDKLDVRVSFDGYYFKKYRYKAADNWRDAPLLIGHTIIAKQMPAKVDAEQGGLFSSVMAVVFMVLLGCVFFVAFALTLWYRRSDQQVQQRISNAQASSFVEPGAAEEPENKPALD